MKMLLFWYLSFDHSYVRKPIRNLTSSQSDRADNDYKLGFGLYSYHILLADFILMFPPGKYQT